MPALNMFHFLANGLCAAYKITCPILNNFSVIHKVAHYHLRQDKIIKLNGGIVLIVRAIQIRFVGKPGTGKSILSEKK
jgi:hypothetical protein